MVVFCRSRVTFCLFVFCARQGVAGHRVAMRVAMRVARKANVVIVAAKFFRIRLMGEAVIPGCYFYECDFPRLAHAQVLGADEFAELSSFVIEGVGQRS